MARSVPKLIDLLSLLISHAIPAGTIVAYAGSTAPTGWLLCNGQSFSATDYPKLAAVLGSTTVPDMRGRFPVGADKVGLLVSKGTAVDGDGDINSKSHTLTVAEIPSHTHTIRSYQAGAVNMGSGGDAGVIFKWKQYGAAKNNDPVDAANTGGGGGHQHWVTMPCVGFNYIICCGGGAANQGIQLPINS